MVERQLPKLHTGVRFPSPAHFTGKDREFWATPRPGRTACAADAAFMLAESRARGAHYTHHEIEMLRSAIGKLPTVRP
jgi:hypothetical protein